MKNDVTLVGQILTVLGEDTAVIQELFGTAKGQQIQSLGQFLIGIIFTYYKYPLADFNITSDVAIVDPSLTETMSKKLTAFAGMDALTHAIEAYVSTLSCDYTDDLALHAIKMIIQDLEDSFNSDMCARTHLHNAQCLAEIAFSNALLGIVHSMAHKTGAAFSGGHIVHGCANATAPSEGYQVQFKERSRGAQVRQDFPVPWLQRRKHNGACRCPHKGNPKPQRPTQYPPLRQGL